MPYRRKGFSRKLRLVTINSEKHQVNFVEALTNVVDTSLVAQAVTAPSNTVTTDCHRGGQIKAIWLSIDFCGTGTSGANVRCMCYLMKDPGDNLTVPSPFTVGSSNEKKFVIKTWSQMVMRNQDGNPPYHWEGWVKIPKRYHRMGTDDAWKFVSAVNAETGHLFVNCIYKEYF